MKQSKPSNSKKTAKTKSQNKQTLGLSKRKPGATRVFNPNGNALSRESLHLRRYELWSEIAIAAGDSTHRIQFDTQTGPAWFKAMSKLYEMYQIHNVKLYIKPTAPTTCGGGWVAAYNTNFDERNTARTAAALGAQLGCGDNAIYKSGSVFIPASAFKGYSTNTSLRSDSNGWLFNFELVCTGVKEACSIKLYILYDLTFRNPQIND